MRPAAPVPRDEGVRERMRAQRVADTGPELAVRGALRTAGLGGYRVGWRLPLPGRRTADIAWPGHRVALFVDGCFWHGCPEHSRPVRNNGAWWAAKVAANRARDAATDRALAVLGWAVVRTWEHDDPGAAVLVVAALVPGNA